MIRKSYTPLELKIVLDDHKLWDLGKGGSRANLTGAYLTGAYLRDANLTGAYLRDADLSNITMNWQSHVLIGTRLQQAAGEEYPKLALAGAISQNPNFCWDWWLDNVPNELLGWALSVMITWIRPGDILPKEFEEVVK